MKRHSVIGVFFTSLFTLIFGRKVFVFKLSLASPVSTSVMAAASPVVAVVITTVCLGRPIAGGGILNVFVKTVKTLVLVLDDRTMDTKKKDV